MTHPSSTTCFVAKSDQSWKSGRPVSLPIRRTQECECRRAATTTQGTAATVPSPGDRRLSILLTPTSPCPLLPCTAEEDSRPRKSPLTRTMCGIQPRRGLRCSGSVARRSNCSRGVGHRSSRRRHRSGCGPRPPSAAAVSASSARRSLKTRSWCRPRRCSRG